MKDKYDKEIERLQAEKAAAIQAAADAERARAVRAFWRKAALMVTLLCCGLTWLMWFGR